MTNSRKHSVLITTAQLIPNFPAIRAESWTCAQQLATGTHKVLPVQDIKRVGTKIMAPPFLNSEAHGFKRQFHGQAALPPGIGPSTPGTDWIQGCGGIQSRSTHFGEDKISCPCPESNHSPVCIPTTSLTLVENYIMSQTTVVEKPILYLTMWTKEVIVS